MRKDHRQRVEELFCEAAGLKRQDRGAFLDQACDDDEELRLEVESLLAHDHHATDAFSESKLGAARDLIADVAAAGPFTSKIPDELPKRIGRYAIVDRIGEGGMGTVFLAEQENPRRRVALKIIRPGAVSRTLLRRFHHETELLGRLQHAGIAQIFEAGAIGTAAGRQPYFAMEYVEGVELRQYVKRDDLSTNARLELLARICDAVQHAHQKGIIHRDLKPDNILVVNESTPTRVGEGDAFATLGQPKVLDFGVAHATDSDIQITTVRSDVGQLVGTVPYMSPEQVGGDSRLLDTRSDVYALGVILYELLSGRLPFELRHKSIPEAARIIREEEPSRLSSFNSIFRGDIETIVAKALEKDRDRRYQSAAEMAEDIRRYLHDQPIIARPASTYYQLRKFAKRNKKLVAVVAMAIVGLTVAMILTTRFALSESAQRKIADRETGVARRALNRANLASAWMALQTNDGINARRLLESVAPESRDSWEWHHLYSCLDTSDVVLAGHTASVTSIDISPDGATLVSASEDTTLLLWDLETMSLIKALRGHGGPVWDVRFNPDGSRIASASDDGWVRIWDPQSGDKLLEFRTEASARRVVFSPDGRYLASNHFDNTIRIWNSEVPGKLPVSTTNEFAQSTDIQFIRDGAEILVGSRRGMCRVDASTGAYFAYHSGDLDYMPISISVSERANRIVTGCLDKTVVLWDAITLKPVLRLFGHTSEVTCCAFNSTGRVVASGSVDQSVRIWDVEMGEVVAALFGHTGAVNSVAFTPDDAWVASGSGDKTIRLWKMGRDEIGSPNRVLRGHTSYVYDVAFDPSDPAGRRIISAAWDGTVGIWDAAAGEAMRTFERQSNLPMHPCRVAFTRDGKRFAWIGDDGTGIGLCDANTGELIRHFELAGSGQSLVFSADGSHIAATANSRISDHRSSAVWEVASGNRIATYETLHTPLLVASSPEGLRFAVFESGDNRVVDAITGEKVVAFRGHDDRVNSFAYSPNGATFLTGSDDRTVGVWDSVTGKRITALRGHTDNVYDAVYSPDGARIASCSNDNTIRLWDAETFEETLELRGHDRYVHALAFSPDGSMIVSASGDTTLRVWDTVPRHQRTQTSP